MKHNGTSTFNESNIGNRNKKYVKEKKETKYI